MTFPKGEMGRRWDRLNTPKTITKNSMPVNPNEVAEKIRKQNSVKAKARAEREKIKKGGKA